MMNAPYSPEEKATAARLAAEGYSTREIAQVLGRCGPSVYQHLRASGNYPGPVVRNPRYVPIHMTWGRACRAPDFDPKQKQFVRKLVHEGGYVSAAELFTEVVKDWLAEEQEKRA